MKVTGGLVREDHLRVGDDRAGDAHQLLLPAGQLIRIQILLSHDLKPIKDVGHHALTIFAADIPVRERNLQVLVHRQVVEQVIALKHEPDMLLVKLGSLLRIQPVDGLVHEVVLARPRAVVHAQDVQQRRLAGARWSHDRDELTILDVDVHAPQHVGAADAVRVRFLKAAQ